MFGFVRLNPQNLKSTPAGLQQEILVSSEDIYRQDRGLEPILLLRKGFELTPDDLPKFLKSGAREHQFYYKHSGKALNPGYQKRCAPKQDRPALSRGMSNPMAHSTLSNLKDIQQKRALIVEPNQKNLKRLIDCLFICGFKLDRIHPVRLVSSVPWAVEKYRPQILIANYDLSNSSMNGLTLLRAFAQLSYVETLILTLPIGHLLSLEENAEIEALSHQVNIKILSKPVSRFALKHILNHSADMIDYKDSKRP
jgi:CheY-like chemotaxis protein